MDIQTQCNFSVSLVKKCHICGEITERSEEIKRCPNCKKSFLPLNYFNKVHAKNTEEFHHLFVEARELHEEDLIKGIYVLW